MSKSLKLFIDWLTNGSLFSETSALRLKLVRKSERRAFGYRQVLSMKATSKTKESGIS